MWEPIRTENDTLEWQLIEIRSWISYLRRMIDGHSFA